MRTGWLVACLLAACGGAHRAPGGAGELDNCGKFETGCDEGAGVIAQASVSLISSDRNAGGGATAAKPSHVRRAGGGAMRRDAPFGGDPYGGFGGDPYGGTSYAHWTAPIFNYVNTIRPAHYAVTTTGLDSTIEGAVTWPGRLPPKLAGTCGAVAALAVGTNRGVRGAIVYIEHVTTGRAIGGASRAQIGGVIAKHGCMLGPTAQISVPLPNSVAIHGDGQRTRIRITPTGGAAKLYDLQEGGLVIAEVKPGVTKIDGEDGKLLASWVIGLETPYVAITDDEGRFRLEQLAPGTYDLTIWQPPIPTLAADGTFAYGKPIVVHRSVLVGVNQAQQISVALPVP
ncbi:hypothetical protein BH11MYX1_BH11MYX1_51310 [soil metagenome]